MAYKTNKSMAYSVRVDDILTYMNVIEYLTHFHSTNHCRCDKVIDLDTDHGHVNIYVDFICPFKLDTDKMYRASFKRYKMIHKYKIKSVFNDHNIIDTILLVHIEDSSESDIEPKPESIMKISEPIIIVGI